MWKTIGHKCGPCPGRHGPLHGANTTLWVENESIYKPTPTPHRNTGKMIKRGLKSLKVITYIKIKNEKI
jgi:hypothetical protein